MKNIILKKKSFYKKLREKGFKKKIIEIQYFGADEIHLILEDSPSSEEKKLIKELMKEWDLEIQELETIEEPPVKKGNR